MGIPSPNCRHNPDSDFMLSYRFELECTQQTVETNLSRSTFYTVVRRKIGELNIIMAGEIDCTTGMNYGSLIGC